MSDTPHPGGARAHAPHQTPPSATPRQTDHLWIIGLWLVLAAVHSPVLSGVMTYFHNDLWSWFLPVHDYLRRELWQGNLLPWCPLVSCGYPLSAEPQTGIFYPLNLIFALPLPINVVMGLALWVHYGLAATGAFALARRFGASALGSFAGALVFAASGFMVAHLHHYAIISAAAWFPWAWYAGYSYRLRPRRRLLVWLWWCSAAQLVAGQPQVWLLTFGSLLVWLLLAECLLPQMKQTRPTGSGLLARWGLPVLAIGLGAGLAAVTILPMLELFQHSTRAKPTLDFVTSYPLSRDSLASFFGRRVTLGDPWEFEGFAGLTTLLLAALAFLKGKDRTRIQLLLAMLVFALFMGMATYNPLYRVIVHLPLVSGFRCAARWLLIISGCLSLVAAWTLTELGERKPWLAVALAGVLACEVMLFAIRYNPVMPAANLAAPSVVSDVQWAGRGADRGRVASVLPLEPPPYERGRALLAPNLNLLWNVPAVDGYMPLQLREFDRLRPLDPQNHPQQAALLGASKLLSPSDGRLPAAGWALVAEVGGMGLYRNRYYHGWCWLEQPGTGNVPNGIAYSYHDGRRMAAMCDASPGPNRIVFSTVWVPWLTAYLGDRVVPLERTAEGLCAVSVPAGGGMVVLMYHHPRLREGLLTSGVALLLFILYMLLISYFRRRPHHVIRHA